MKKKLLSLISAVLCLCMVLSACGGPANNDPSSSISESQGGDNTQDKTLTIATMTETTTLSPLYMGVYNYSMCTMLYETLLKYEDGEVKGNLAESYSFNEDGTVIFVIYRLSAGHQLGGADFRLVHSVHLQSIVRCPKYTGIYPRLRRSGLSPLA